jgi:KipI family sensor histidine kinase inhibitor
VTDQSGEAPLAAPARLVPAGETALLVVLGDRVEPALNDRVHALTRALDDAPWVTELTPGYASLLVEYEPAAITPADAEAAIRGALALLPAETRQETRLRQVPTVYGGAEGPDLARVAEQVGLAAEEIVRLHANTLQRVYMLGFVPGHPYMGDLPAALDVPRLATPRTTVPQGSVAIAGGQTVIYALTAPGGWSILGRTALRLFDPYQDPPAYFRPGDHVRFVPVEQADFAADDAPAPAAPPVVAADPALEIVAGGLQTLVQDLGRWGYARYGVPRSGPMDPFAARAATCLVGNGPDAAGLEITFGGPTIRFRRECLIAVTGADLSPSVDGAAVPGWTAQTVAAGAVLKFGRRRAGLRAYLAVAGGLAVPPVLGSRATYLRGGFGGLAGRALAAGDRLDVGLAAPDASRRAGCSLAAEQRPAYRPDPTVRVLLGPHDDRFPMEAIEQLLSTAYAVAPDSDRMGYRLAGPRLARREPADLVSGGMSLGGIQVPGDGQPIILLSDHQTTGGYPLLATVIQADLPLVAQLAPGQSLRFKAVSLEAARAAYLAMLASLETSGR